MEINICTLGGGSAHDPGACILLADMRIISIDSAAPDVLAIDEAAEILRRGQLVAFPTETVYGLGANALDASAVARIFAAKGRPSYNPLIVHVPDEAAARELVREWPESASRLARAFWPGPVTLVLRKQSAIPDIVTAGLDSVALRVPAHPVALALLRAAAVPLAAPSANRSMSLSPTTAQHVARSLGDRVELILDGGPTTVGIESTVVDLRGAQPSILRPGVLGASEIEPIVGALAVPNEAAGDAPRLAPGMLDRHYAPRARLILFGTADAPTVIAAAEEARASGGTVGMLVIETRVGGSNILRMPNEALEYARRLYASLHALDESNCEVIYVERVPGGPEWAGVRDRLERAARQ
jgi:L-threonylcarbamoyladenylate synthase